MDDVYTLVEGSLPLLVSVPHDGRELMPGQHERMTPAGRGLPDTDWHVARLYEFATAIGASMIVANYSRYVVDLNRPAEDGPMYPDQLSTGICPVETFAGDEIYIAGARPDEQERAERIKTYWQPYHAKIEDTLAKLQAENGYALLWDAHSIPSTVPRLFDGELPVLNIGTYGGLSAAPDISEPVAVAAQSSPYSNVTNGRFKGGYITRHYGDPAERRSAVQLEIAQRAYMDEASGEYDESAANKLRDTLTAMFKAFLEAARRHYS